MVQKFQEVCLNGHQLSVTKKDTANPVPFCSKCGEKVISVCQECNAPIHGWLENDRVTYIGPRKKDRPSYCSECGKPYPWTSLVLHSAVELLALDENLSEHDKQLIKTAIPDLLVDTPKTKVAETKFKKGFSMASSTIKNSLYNLLVDVLSDTAKKSIFPD